MRASLAIQLRLASLDTVRPLLDEIAQDLEVLPTTPETAAEVRSLACMPADPRVQLVVGVLGALGDSRFTREVLRHGGGQDTRRAELVARVLVDPAGAPLVTARETGIPTGEDLLSLALVADAVVEAGAHALAECWVRRHPADLAEPWQRHEATRRPWDLPLGLHIQNRLARDLARAVLVPMLPEGTAPESLTRTDVLRHRLLPAMGPLTLGDVAQAVEASFRRLVERAERVLAGMPPAKRQRLSAGAPWER